MSKTLYLYYTESLQNLSSQSTIQWCLEAGFSLHEQDLTWATNSLAELSNTVNELKDEHGEHLNISLILAVENLFCTHVELPGKQSKYLKQALPFLVEEKLSIDIDSMHLATGPRFGDNCYSVIAVDRSHFQRLLELLKESGVEPHSAFGDAQLLDPTELYIGDTRSLLSLESGEAIAVENTDVELLINSAFNNEAALDSMETPKLQVHYASELSSEIELQLQALDSSHSAQVTIAPDPIEFIKILLGRARNKVVVNLLQGDFTAKKAKAQSDIHWKPMVIAAALLLTLQIGYLIGSGYYFEQKAENISMDTEKLYREYFPQDKRIQHIKRQTMAHLRQSSGGGKDFSTLLSAFGNSWQKTNDSSTKLNQLRYNAKRNQMTLEIEAKTINQLDILQRELSLQGIKAELISANESDSGVRGRLQLGG